jgi:hypothetical protein
VVYQAVAIAPKELAFKALRWLLEECQPVDHWRAKRAICAAIIQAVSLHWAGPADLLPLVQDERLRNNIAIRLNRGEVEQPRTFFWPLH